MTQVALYRKYRPQAFEQVVGQDQVVKTLHGAIAKGNISHAYLFAGTRGTGKTSIARIFAKEIGTHENDLYELDAASNRGIDEMRSLREAVNTLPFSSRYKVYIIDECHMLTKEAFNALLKTLEEPPSHVVFILATTEIEKLPDTIVSRCETHIFKQPSRAVLKDRIQQVAKLEGFEIESAVAELIALLADGSFRDALGVLQKVINTSGDTKITFDEVSLITGAPKKELVNDVITALEERDAKKGLEALRSAADGGVDMRIFAKLLLEKMRAVLLLRYVPSMREQFAADFSPDDMKLLEDHAVRSLSQINSKSLVAFLDAYTEIGKASVAQLPLELALLEVIGNTVS